MVLFDRFIPQLDAARQGEPTVALQALQEQLRRIWEAIHKVEGRLGTVNTLDDLIVHGTLDVEEDLLASANVEIADTTTFLQRPVEPDGTTAPDIALSGKSKLYYDLVAQRLRLSENERNFADLLPYEAVRVYNSANQAIGTGAYASLTFDTERFDTASMWSAGAPTIITIPTSGIYAVGAGVLFDSNATGARFLAIRLNAGNFIVHEGQPTASGTFASIIAMSTVWRFTAGDTLDVRVFQNSGGNLNVTRTADYANEFWAARIM